MPHVWHGGYCVTPCRTDHLGHTVPVQLILRNVTTIQHQRTRALQSLIQAESTSQTFQCICWLLITLRMAGPTSGFWGIDQLGSSFQPKPSSVGGVIDGHLSLGQGETAGRSHPWIAQLEGLLRVNSATIHILTILGLMWLETHSVSLYYIWGQQGDSWPLSIHITFLCLGNLSLLALVGGRAPDPIRETEKAR